MSKARTDHSSFPIKLKLRQENLPQGKCRVLDCFGGNGLLWNAIKKFNQQREITVLRIDNERGKNGIYLVGDNLKFLKNIDLNNFDVIDLDSYGVPYKQLKCFFEKKSQRKITVFLTFIQSIYGGLPRDFLCELGFTRKMVNKCPSLFYRKGFEKLKHYLAIHGVEKIKYYQNRSKRKNYLCFQTGKKAKRA